MYLNKEECEGIYIERGGGRVFGGQIERSTEEVVTLKKSQPTSKGGGRGAAILLLSL